MKQEYKEKLELTKKLLNESLLVESNELGEKMFDNGYALMEELVQTKDEEVLCGLFDLFTKELDHTGICETLENAIFKNFNETSIINALSDKFNQLLVNNISRAVCISQRIVEYGNFDNFKKMFNFVKAERSKDFLNEFYDWYPELNDKISILRKDMSRW